MCNFALLFTNSALCSLLFSLLYICWLSRTFPRYTKDLFCNKTDYNRSTQNFSEIISKIVGENKIVLDPFHGSGALLESFPNSLGIDIKQYWWEKRLAHQYPKPKSILIFNLTISLTQCLLIFYYILIYIIIHWQDKLEIAMVRRLIDGI